jgi:hypothetical protein
MTMLDGTPGYPQRCRDGRCGSDVDAITPACGPEVRDDVSIKEDANHEPKGQKKPSSPRPLQSGIDAALSRPSML